MTQRTPLALLIFAGLIFIVFVMMLITVLPTQTVVFTDDEEADTGIQEYDPVKGEENAPIIITHYSDFLCETCADVAMALNSVSQDYPDEITLVWKDFPNVYAHPLATSASLAARCAGEQGAFWEFHDLLFAHQRDINEATINELFKEIADELNLGSWRFNRCINKQQTFKDMEASYQDAVDLELISSPTISINGQWYTGIISENEIRSAILNLELIP